MKENLPTESNREKYKLNYKFHLQISFTKLKLSHKLLQISIQKYS